MNRILLFIAVFAVAAGTFRIADGVPPAEEIGGGGKSPGHPVTVFCQSWKRNDLDAMFRVLCQTGLGKDGKENFKNRFGSCRQAGGNLAGYSLQTISQQGNAVIVKALLRFQKELPPRMISGLHTFAIVKELGEWRINYILPPLPPPRLDQIRRSGGSRPGMQ